MEDTIWFILFQIAMGEPYEITDDASERALAFFCALVATLTATMLVTALIQLIESDAATDAALEAGTKAALIEDRKSAAAAIIHNQWQNYLYYKAHHCSAKVDAATASREQELLQGLMCAKQQYRQACQRYSEGIESKEGEAQNTHQLL